MFDQDQDRQADVARATGPQIDAPVMTHPLHARVTPLIVAHGASISLAVVATVRIGGPWAVTLLEASLVVLAARLLVLRHAPAGSGATTDRPEPIWRRRYELVGLVWAGVSAALCGYCVAGGDDVTRLLAVALAYGVAGGIAARTVGAPRFAMALLCLWLVPLIVASGLLGAGYWLVALLTLSYLTVMCLIVRQQDSDIRPLVGAELQGRVMQGTLAVRDAEFRAIFHNSAAGVVEADLTVPRILRVNPVYCRMTGRSEAELLGLSLSDVTHPEDRAGDSRWEVPAEIGQNFYYERRYLRPDGSIVWGRVSSTVLSLRADGRPARIFAVSQDCTEQRMAEAALRANEEMLRLSLRIGRCGSFRNDYRAQVIICGLESRLMHGLPMDDVPVPMADWFAMILPEDRVRLAAAIDAAHAARQEVTEFEYRFTHPVSGIRHLETRSRTTYDEDGKPVESVGAVIDVTERRRAEAHIAYLAHHDPLTGLPNRTLFQIRLDEALALARGGESFALLWLDLDHFKDVNDTVGHSVGDALLVAVTARLGREIRSVDTLARLGGDEFAVIQVGRRQPEDAIALAERMIAAMQMPFDLDGSTVAIGVSIGIDVAAGDGLQPETLLRQADLALYAAKADGRGRARLFEPHMDFDLRARHSLGLDLRDALNAGQFELFYQPIVNVARRAVCGFEALIRWRHPSRGLVMPDRFIPLAEATGLLVPIGAWVLRQACAEAAGWASGARIAVNLSAVQFPGGALVDTVRTAFQDYGLEPHRLDLEITETAMLQDTEATLTTLHALKELGVTITLDDFGTGYSSLSYLQRFPFDKVKIDRSFISNLDSRRESAPIVSAVIELCGSLHMMTCGEGVETEAQLAALARIGCDEVQGYYFSRPRPAAEIPAMIARIDGLAELQQQAARQTDFSPASG